MQLNRTKMLIGAAVVVLVFAGAVWWLLNRAEQPADNQANVNLKRSASEVQFDKDLDAFAKSDWRGALDDRIEIIGGSLVNVPLNIMTDRIAAETKRTVHMNFTEGMTTRQAIGTLSTMLANRPPSMIVFDIGRYDASNGISTQETVGNLSAILFKSEDLGIRTVVIGGTGADGNIELASLIHPAVTGSAIFIDASSMLQNPELRTSPVELNDSGEAMLAEQVSAVLVKD